MNPYSTRFMLFTGGAGWHYYQVPVGERAIVKEVNIYNPTQANIEVDLSIAGIPIWSGQAPPAPANLRYQGMAVLNAGEQLGVYVAGATTSVCVSGYLLSAP